VCVCINMCMPQTAASVLHEVCRYRSGCVAMAQHEHVLKVITQLPFGTIQKTEANAAKFRPSQFGELEQALAGILFPDHSLLSPLSCWRLGCMNLFTSNTCLTRCFNALLRRVDRSTRRSKALKNLIVISALFLSLFFIHLQSIFIHLQCNRILYSVHDQITDTGANRFISFRLVKTRHHRSCETVSWRVWFWSAVCSNWSVRLCV